VMDGCMVKFAFADVCRRIEIMQGLKAHACSLLFTSTGIVIPT
jgi:hypothetical protein